MLSAGETGRSQRCLLPSLTTRVPTSSSGRHVSEYTRTLPPTNKYVFFLVSIGRRDRIFSKSVQSEDTRKRSSKMAFIFLVQGRS